MKGRGGGRLKHDNVDGDVPLCLRKTEGKSKDGSSSNKKNNVEKSKMVSGSKDLCGDSTRKRNDEKTVSKEVTFIVLQRKFEINALKVKESKKWYASLNATDGTQYY